MKKNFDIKLFLILIFVGWIGIDKLYFKSLNLCLIKLFLTPIGIGIVWNIFDIVSCIMGKYKLNPLS